MQSNRKTAPTMLDVATLAGVSVATVSAAVNGTSPVSTQLRSRIEEAILTIGYKRNAVARSLKTGTTKTIGLVVADITNPFFTDVIAVIQDVLHKAGYAVMLGCTDESPAIQEEQVSLLLDRMVDGLVIAPTGDDERLRRLVGTAAVPVVLIDRLCNEIDADAVVLDNEDAVRSAVQYLIELGHRDIGYVSGPLNMSTGRDRLAGYRAALKGAGIDEHEGFIRLGNFREKDAYAATMQMLLGTQRPTAIFAANNLMVIGVMKAIRDTGLSCPADISVASFDDFPWADVFQPNLTTIAQPVQAIGEQAAARILEQIGGKERRPPLRVVLKGRLMVRGSCRPVSTLDAPR
jgi:LacI family transcriptional regulator